MLSARSPAALDHPTPYCCGDIAADRKKVDPRAIVGEQRMIGPEADLVDRIIIDRLRAPIGLGKGRAGLRASVAATCRSVPSSPKCGSYWVSPKRSRIGGG